MTLGEDHDNDSSSSQQNKTDEDITNVHLSTKKDAIVVHKNDEMQVATINPPRLNPLSGFRWCPTSEEMLIQSESFILSVLKRPYKDYFVDIGAGWGNDKNNIRTIEMLTDREINCNDLGANMSNEARVPLVMVHGFASGVAFFILNLDELASSLDRKVYAFDILGFGRSSRAPFDLNEGVENQFVDSIEKWRQRQNIERFILLGHSFGGLLAGTYALKYPSRVAHLILADPWGIQDRERATKIIKLPLWVRIMRTLLQPFNPLSIIRAVGPLGPKLIHRFRKDLREKFRPKLGDDCHKFLDYIYHCNAQQPTGEIALKALITNNIWPLNPLVYRLCGLDESIHLTFIYGSRSWIEQEPADFLQETLGNDRVEIRVIQGSGHHVYADRSQEFNEYVTQVCSSVDE